ncbi:MAG TPA: tetratricopeptide repeat protein [Candidatus Omnitrophota bacterium]|nr:tetratricopeptide repeat protein [Candidatus Omnitrophota bacterium]HPT07903.1 tetratricopeptide repeat protein [Candidatus Omnitrophota bacterium]
MQFEKIPSWGLVVVLGVLSILLYANGVRGEFIIDDRQAIMEKRSVHDLRQYFSKEFSLRPGIIWDASRAVLWKVGNHGAFAFHLLNLVLHVGCVILLFFLISILFCNRLFAFLSALIFAVHPIHAEAVSWISAGHNVLVSVFFIAAMILYVKAHTSRGLFFLSLISALFCFLSGSAGVTLPVLFIAYDIWFRPRSVDYKRWRTFRWTVLALLSALCLVSVAIAIIGRNTAIYTIFHYKGFGHFVVVIKAFAYYCKILYLPIQRGLYHSFAYQTTHIQSLSPIFFVSVGIIVITIAAFFRCLAKNPAVSFGIAWFVITYLPVSNIVPVCNIIAERYMYLPSAGFAMIMAFLFLKVWGIINQQKSRVVILRRYAVAAVTLYLASYGILTLKHNQDYNDIVTYWETNIVNFPDGYLAYNNLAGTFYEMGDRQQAYIYSWMNLAMKPDQPGAWCNLGRIHRDNREYAQAIACYKKALEYDKSFIIAKQALQDMERYDK